MEPKYKTTFSVIGAIIVLSILATIFLNTTFGKDVFESLPRIRLR
ncbi:hypothetical protein RH915_02855 [Serpentinicella sp. ANB-PHB4]|nr:hypothetical protein [Serpentinicella sp. ANB-PHB4]MDR5658421.1 hypothetical protein [Serpentinicella sp. ANB-PHB4]